MQPPAAPDRGWIHTASSLEARTRIRHKSAVFPSSAVSIFTLPRPLTLRTLKYSRFSLSGKHDKANESPGDRRPGSRPTGHPALCATKPHLAPGPDLRVHPGGSLACGRGQGHRSRTLLFACQVHLTLCFSLDQEPGSLSGRLPGNVTKGRRPLFPDREAMVAAGPADCWSGRGARAEETEGPRGVRVVMRRSVPRLQPLHELPQGQNCTHSRKYGRTWDSEQDGGGSTGAAPGSNARFC